MIKDFLFDEEKQIQMSRMNRKQIVTGKTKILNLHAALC
jgi:hypothetical protein